MLNAWTEDEVTLSDLYEAGATDRGDPDTLQRLTDYVMDKKGIKKDLSRNRL